MKNPPGPPKGYFSPIFPLAYRRIAQVSPVFAVLHCFCGDFIFISKFALFALHIKLLRLVARFFFFILIFSIFLYSLAANYDANAVHDGGTVVQVA